MVYVVTAVHNRFDITKAFVERIKRQTYKDIVLVLVDDGCTDGTPDMVKKEIPDAVILHGDGNLWWSGGLHMAYKYLKNVVKDTDIVLISNDDASFVDDYIERAVAQLNNYSNTILTGYGESIQTGKQVDGAIDYDFNTCVPKMKKNGQVNFGNCASTRSLFVNAGDFIKVGGFHPKMLPMYFSDYEWTIRAVRKCNLKIVCVPDIKYGVNEETTGDHSKSNRTLKQLMQKRSVSNPVYKANFCLLAAPWGKKLLSIFVSLKRAFVK